VTAVPRRAEFPPLSLLETERGNAGTAVLKKGAATVAVFRRKREIRRVREVLHLLRAKGIPLDRLDDTFLAVLAVYLGQERDFNSELLQKEIRRLQS
jgi:hypothetical protein